MRVLIILLIMLAACSPKTMQKETTTSKSDSTKKVQKEDEEMASYEKIDHLLSSTVVDTSECITIDKKIAIMTTDTTWIEEQRKSMSEEDWSEVVADHKFYQAEALAALNKAGITTENFSNNKRYLRFVKNGKKIVYLNKSKLRDKWGLILFNPDKNPVFWNSTNIDDAIKDVYNQ